MPETECNNIKHKTKHGGVIIKSVLGANAMSGRIIITRR